MSDQDLKDLVAAVATLDITAEKPKEEFATAAEDAQVYNLPFDRTFPSFEPMVHDETFLPEEYHSPIALLNNNYWQDQKALDEYATIKARADTWFQATKVTDEELEKISTQLTANITAMIADPDAQFDRIFIRDTERAFNAPKRRTALCHILTYLKGVTLQGDYHQGLSMMCAFLHCFLPAPKVIAMAIHANEKLLPKVWKSQSVATAVDGYVLFKMLETSQNPKHNDIVNHFQKVYIIPEMFVSKYWCAIAVHLLPFQSIVTLFDRFWTVNGVLALYESIFIVLFGQYEAIMKTTTTDKLLELIALDHKILTPTYVNNLTYCYPDGVVPDYAKEAAELVEQLSDHYILQACREDAFQTHIEPRIERSAADFAKLTAKEPDCQRAECSKKVEQGFYYCMDCKIHLCEDCAYCAWGDHNDDDHDIRINDDVDE
jgi:hypothetical protein